MALMPTLVHGDETIEFPEEELATESVLPVFDKTQVVKNRAITTEGRFEFGGGVGLNLIEALYETLTYNLTASYHLDETRGVNFDFIMTQTGLSDMGDDLKNGVGFSTSFNPDLAPAVEHLIFANYQLTTYYGKISVTKERAMNLSLYGLFGAGLVSWGDAYEPALNLGVGQKFYFNNDWALRVDLNLAAYRGPDPTDPKGANNTLTSGSKRDSDDFETIYYFRSFLRGALVYLF